MKGEATLELGELLEYAFGGHAPRGFVEHLIRSRHLWDEEFRRRLDELAYEFRPDLAVWQLEVDEGGRLLERRLAPKVLGLDPPPSGGHQSGRPS